VRDVKFDTSLDNDESQNFTKHFATKIHDKSNIGELEVKERIENVLRTSNNKMVEENNVITDK
jgi:hypothetical protein